MEKKGVETKILKMRGKLGKGIGALNKRGRGGGGGGGGGGLKSFYELWLTVSLPNQDPPLVDRDLGQAWKYFFI